MERRKRQYNKFNLGLLQWSDCAKDKYLQTNQEWGGEDDYVIQSFLRKYLQTMKWMQFLVERRRK
jgi:hypothetical protein